MLWFSKESSLAGTRIGPRIRSGTSSTRWGLRSPSSKTDCTTSTRRSVVHRILLGTTKALTANAKAVDSSCQRLYFSSQLCSWLVSTVESMQNGRPVVRMSDPWIHPVSFHSFSGLWSVKVSHGAILKLTQLKLCLKFSLALMRYPQNDLLGHPSTWKS
jgi:hypothetical protein